MEKWIMKKDNCNIIDTSKKLKLPIYLTKIITNRGLIDKSEVDQFFNPSITLLHDPEFLPDAELSFSIISEFIAEGQRIRIIGDYDVDGIMSTYIIYTCLKKLGADVDYRIPNRVEEGYGLNKNIIDEASVDKIGLIITCDNGIASVDEIEYAQSLDISVIVTDHHDIPFDSENPDYEILPDADAIVNPKLKESLYPFRNLCGASVAFKLMEYVYARYSALDDDFYDLLQYVAIATICDIMELVGENRVIVKYGLEILRKTENIGLKTLIKSMNIDIESIEASNIGFSVGPVINSSGRLSSAELALDLLLSTSKEEAETVTSELFKLNTARRNETERGVREALSTIERANLHHDKVIIAELENAEESIIGIIAGRIKDKFNRPTIIMTKGVDYLKASARSIDGYDMYGELNKVKDMLPKFGGHTMAAGFSISDENVEEFRKIINENCKLEEEDFVKTIRADIKFPISNMSREVVTNLSKMEPFGNGNEKPVLADLGVSINKITLIGKNKNVAKFFFNANDNSLIEGIMFKRVDDLIKDATKKCGAYVENDNFVFPGEYPTIDLLYYPTINNFFGDNRIQLDIISFRF